MTISKRIKSVLDTLINEDQKGFMSGRYIGDITRQIYDLIEYTDTYPIPGLLLSIDFEMAFDTIDWSFILKTLTFFNFGEKIKNG